MKVLITGGTGSVGATATQRFVDKGWDVRVIGLETAQEVSENPLLSGAEYIQCDIGDFPSLCKAVEGCQTVVHLGAISNPMVAPGEEVFRVNVAGTYYVFEAAAQAGIKRIVQASSINAFGCFWGTIDRPPPYLPIDESQASYTTDAYSFSKEMVENIGAYYWRREGISSVALRLPGVWPVAMLTDEAHHAGLASKRKFIEQLLEQPEEEIAKCIEAAQERTKVYRAQRSLEYPAAANGIKGDGGPSDPLWNMWRFDRLNYWAYVDGRDAAQAMEKGLTADYEGSHPLYITAANNYLNYSTWKLMNLFYPEVNTFHGFQPNAETLVSIDKARELIGYEPEYAITA